MRYLWSAVILAVTLQAHAQDDEGTALANVVKFGGKYERVPQLDGSPFVWMAITDQPVTDEDLKLLRGLRHVKGLRTLGLNGTKITDAGLKELQGLKDLETLG